MYEKPAHYDDLVRQATRARKAKDYDRAIALYTNAAEAYPPGTANLFKALAMRDAGDVDGAIAVLKIYAPTHPNDVDGWTMLGTICKQNKRFKDAIYPLQRALAIKKTPELLNVLTTSLWQIGEIDAAKTCGLHNLNLKDRTVRENFPQTAWREIRLQPPRHAMQGAKAGEKSKPGKKIIAFSLWGDKPEYVTGAIVNAQIAKHIYVGWKTRFYCDETVPSDALALLEHFGAEVVRMDAKRDAKTRPMWRFFVADDPEVDIFICRDADSRLNAQELIAVEAWLASGKPVHIMRDHIYHMELILAGMWGALGGVLPPMRAFLESATQYHDNKFADQAFLGEMVWPLVRDHALIHDTYYTFPEAQPFPAGYRLPGKIHVGGGTKTMPHWNDYVGRNVKLK